MIPNKNYLNFRMGSATFRIVSINFKGSKQDRRVTTNNVARTILFALLISMLIQGECLTSSDEIN